MGGVRVCVVEVEEMEECVMCGWGRRRRDV